MEASAQLADDVLVLDVRGEADLATVWRLEAAIDPYAHSGEAKAMVADLTDCDFIDSTALNFLLVARRTFDGRIAVVCRPQGAVDRMLALTVRGLLDTYPSREAALAAAAHAVAA